MIELNNINKSFGANNVLCNLNWKIEPNELIYLHGKNGCGKSTLLKIICDILQPDSGEIKKSDLLNLGALIENPGFLETENIKYNLTFLASLKNNCDINYISELCSFFELNFNSNTKLKNYSVGMRQKVGIIQAIMEHQNVILFDEPTRGLDDKSIDSFIHKVNELKNQGNTIIIASHDYLPSIQFTKRYLLEEGKLILE